MAEDLQLAQSSVTELVDRAEAAGLVVRASADGDARTVLVRLSETGDARLRAAVTAVRSEREQLLEHLDQARSQQGEGICIASLPLMVEEIAAEEAGGDADLELEIVAQLRRRVGLSA